MRISIALISTFFVWTAFDLNRFRRRDTYSAQGGVEQTLTDEQLQRRRLVQPRSKAVIPSWMNAGPTPVRQRVKYLSVKSRDPRDSDQRKIRRRFNNM